MSSSTLFRAYHHGGGDPRVKPYMAYSRECSRLSMFFDNVEREDLCVELMECTGLKDKNGTPIYEGDIVTMFGLPEGFEVKFRYGAFGYDPVISRKGTTPLIPFANHSAYTDIMRTIEVIGNIHTNPELLESK